jgi:hypothetical protein
MRSMSVRAVTFLVIAASVAACSGSDADTAAKADSISAASAANAVLASEPQPTAIDISNYELDMDKMRRYAAAIKGFSALPPGDTAGMSGLTMSSDESSAQTIAKLEAHPGARRVLSEAGLSASEYVWITAAYLQAAMTQGLLQVSPSTKIPAGQSRRNVDFLVANKAELESIMKDAGMKD